MSAARSSKSPFKSPAGSRPRAKSGTPSPSPSPSPSALGLSPQESKELSDEEDDEEQGSDDEVGWTLVREKNSESDDVNGWTVLRDLLSNDLLSSALAEESDKYRSALFSVLWRSLATNTTVDWLATLSSSEHVAANFACVMLLCEDHFLNSESAPRSSVAMLQLLIGFLNSTIDMAQFNTQLSSRAYQRATPLWSVESGAVPRPFPLDVLGSLSVQAELKKPYEGFRPPHYLSSTVNKLVSVASALICQSLVHLFSSGSGSVSLHELLRQHSDTLFRSCVDLQPNFLPLLLFLLFREITLDDLPSFADRAISKDMVERIICRDPLITLSEIATKNAPGLLRALLVTSASREQKHRKSVQDSDPRLFPFAQFGVSLLLRKDWPMFFQWLSGHSSPDTIQLEIDYDPERDDADDDDEDVAFRRDSKRTGEGHTRVELRRQQALTRTRRKLVRSLFSGRLGTVWREYAYHMPESASIPFLSASASDHSLAPGVTVAGSASWSASLGGVSLSSSSNNVVEGPRPRRDWTEEVKKIFMTATPARTQSSIGPQRRGASRASHLSQDLLHALDAVGLLRVPAPLPVHVPLPGSGAKRTKRPRTSQAPASAGKPGAASASTTPTQAARGAGQGSAAAMSSISSTVTVTCRLAQSAVDMLLANKERQTADRQWRMQKKWKILRHEVLVYQRRSTSSP